MSTVIDAVRNGFDDVRPARNIAELWRERPKSALVRLSVAALVAIAVYAWSSGDIGFDDMFTARRAQNLHRFLTVDVQPFELRESSLSLGAYLAWAWKLGVEHGFEGARATIAISILAITISALAAAGLCLFAARNVSTSRPFETAARTGRGSLAWTVVTQTTRALLVFMRAIPEYIWAFLFLAMLGASAWPAVLALAIHNAGILGKLGAETVENLDPESLRALRTLGATRAEVALVGIFPASLSRFLLYVFYRFETCVREATVLGMLGVVSLGYWIQDARSRQFYDQMVLFVGFGALIVLLADLFSSIVRAKLRRAS